MNLQQWIEYLRETNQLIEIDKFVSINLEITKITDKVCKEPNGGKAILFNNNETDFPVLTNLYGSDSRILKAIYQSDYKNFSEEINSLFATVTQPQGGISNIIKKLSTLKNIASILPKTTKNKGRCQEVIMTNPDITKLPVLTCWPQDGGPFVTLPVVHTICPETKTRNVGMYRMQVFDKQLTGMHWHIHKDSAKHFRLYKKQGKKMPISVTLGGDPIYAYAATAPLPPGIDEYILAGFLRKKPVKLVKCLTNDIYVPEDADFVIEGYINPNEEFIWEGPFGDHTGFYSLADYYPKFHITAITHQKKAIYPATIVGIPPMEDAYIAKATERLFLPLMQKSMLPEVIDFHLPEAGVAHNIAIIAANIEYPGHANKIMNTLWGAGQMMFTKIIIIVDKTINIRDYTAVCKAISTNSNFLDITISQGPTDVLDHAAYKPNFGGKIGIDATQKTTINKYNPQINKTDLLSLFPEISAINTNLTNIGFPILFLTIHKEKPNHVYKLSKKIIENNLIKDVLFICFIENEKYINDIYYAVWQLVANIDPLHNAFMLTYNSKKIWILDGTKKTKELDNFTRLWPDEVIMEK